MPLVTRVGRGVRLTDAGRVLADHADAVLRPEDTAVAAVRALQATMTGRLTIGTFGSAGAALLAPLVVALAQEHPGIDVRSQVVEVDDSAAAVRRGQVDVAFGVDYANAPIPRDPDVQFIRLRSERFLLAAPPGFDTEPSIELARAADRPWILTPGATQFGQAIRNACRAVGFESRVLHEVTDTAVCLAWPTPVSASPRSGPSCSGCPGPAVRLSRFETRSSATSCWCVTARSGTGPRPGPPRRRWSAVVDGVGTRDGVESSIG